MTKRHLDCLYWPVAHYIAKKAEDLVIVPGRSPIYMAEDLDIYIYMAEDLDIYMAEDLDTLYMAGRIGFWVGDWAGYICRSRIDLGQYIGMSAVAVISIEQRELVFVMSVMSVMSVMLSGVCWLQAARGD